MEHGLLIADDRSDYELGVEDAAEMAASLIARDRDSARAELQEQAACIDSGDTMGCTDEYVRGYRSVIGTALQTLAAIR